MLKKYDAHKRSTFVRKAVLEIPVTTKILDAIMPYFPKDCKVIAGYLSSDDQYWKINFHWEYLRDMLETALTKDLSEKHAKCVKAIKAALVKNAPRPSRGYKKSQTVGKPVDASSKQLISARWKTVRQCKRDFKLVIDKAGLLAKNPPSKQAWHLAVAPVAAPGTSKHGNGYAVDIAGDNKLIKKIAKELGATLAFDEKSHVHVEFKNGVKLPKSKVQTKQTGEFKFLDDPSTKFYSDNQCLTPLEISRLQSMATTDAFKSEGLAPSLRGASLSKLIK